MAWSETQGVKVPANIIPSSPYDTYPTHHANFGRGGYKTVATLTDKDSIPVDRLTIGSVVRVHADGIEYVITNIPSNAQTGKDCTWEPIKSGGFDEEALEALKGKPNGLAELDSDGLVPEKQSRAIIYRGEYVNETTFNSAAGSPHNKSLNAIYIDDRNGKMYTWTGDKFVRDALYWNIV